MKKIKVKVAESSDTRLKRITLFLLESIMIQKFRPIDDTFAIQFNDFLYSYYEDNKELFGYLFNTKVLEKNMKNNCEILSLEQIASLIVKYRGFKGYINLLDDVGLEVAGKLNDLALLFTEYYDSLVNLYLEEPKSGHIRILN